MVLNFGRARPETILDLTRIEELKQHGRENGMLGVGAGVTYTRAIAELGEQLPGLAIASRTVGSPQIRNRGTIGGNLGSSSPAGDALPPLYASDAEVELASAKGTRRVLVEDFITGPKRNVLEPDELMAAFRVAPPRARSSSARSAPATRW
jgi:CO/xanthine dehydrogenase FAD-binding subunit